MIRIKNVISLTTYKYVSFLAYHVFKWTRMILESVTEMEMIFQYKIYFFVIFFERSSTLLIKKISLIWKDVYL